ncbi:hypothetical protein Mapa_013982 [Marchantia paleacea]|nr:hypothetical protein Mapa_013982 [Marchantia paleacea]
MVPLDCNLDGVSFPLTSVENEMPFLTMFPPRNLLPRSTLDTILKRGSHPSDLSP